MTAAAAALANDPTTVTPDDVATQLPPLAQVPGMSAVGAVDMARRVHDRALQLAYDGTDDLEGVVGLRRQLHSLGAVLSRRPELPPDVLLDIDVATRCVERAAIDTISAAQVAGRIHQGERTRTAWLGEIASSLFDLHSRLDWSAFADAIKVCRDRGSVTFSALAAQVRGTAGPVVAAVPQVVEPAKRDRDEVSRLVAAVLKAATDAAGVAAGLGDEDVSTLEPAEASDLARGLWRELVTTTALYSSLARRGKARIPRSGA